MSTCDSPPNIPIMNHMNILKNKIRLGFYKESFHRLITKVHDAFNEGEKVWQVVEKIMQKCNMRSFGVQDALFVPYEVMEALE
jgi:hypothetical protein